MTPTPSELRMILGKNLQKLCENSVSISEVCRQIGVNRTQFNRYLNGVAFPRPDVLFRICRHFNVDANIMLQPLEDILSSKSDSSPASDQVYDASDILSGGSERPFDHYLLPDGVYTYWRKSFRQPQRAYQGLALIKSEGQGKIWKGYDIHDLPIRSGSPRFARSSCYVGRLVQQFDGFALLSRTHYSDLMNITYFEYGMDHMPDYYSGISFVTRRRLPESNRITAVVMQRLPNTCAARISAARKCGSYDINALPPLLKGALDRIPDLI